MKGNRISAIWALLTAAALLLAGCGQGGGTDGSSGSAGSPASGTAQGNVSGDSQAAGEEDLYNEPGAFPILKEKITQTIALAQDPTVTDYDTNKFTRLLEERTNIHLEFTILPAGDEAKQKLSVMINAGDTLPDIVNLNLLDNEIYHYGTMGAFIPLNQYYENDAYYIREWGDFYTDALRYVTSADGNVYTVPKIDGARGNELSRKAWIFQPWLDQFGLEIPQTTDEFYTALKTFLDQDANGNGQRDEIPFAGSRNGWSNQVEVFLMNAFIYCNPESDYLILRDGKILPAYTQPEWKAGLEYMNKLCAEELMSPLSFTQEKAQFSAMLAGSDDDIVGAFPANRPQHPVEDMRKTQYSLLPPLAGPEGVRNAVLTNSSIPKGVFYVTKYCQHPKAAFLLADYMQSEEALLYHRYGEEGVDWERSTQQAIYEGAKNVVDPILPWGQPQNAHWGAANPLTWSDSFVSEGWDGVINPENQNYYQVIIAQANPVYEPYIPGEVYRMAVYSTEELEEISDIRITLNEYLMEQSVAFITGHRSFSEWDNYVQEMETIGLSRFVEVTQNAHDRMTAN